jgi:hypothetical protein
VSGTSTVSSASFTGLIFTVGRSLGYGLAQASSTLPTTRYTLDAQEIRAYTAPAPAKEYWLRERPVDPPLGPFSHKEADYRARKITKRARQTGRGPVALEMIKYVTTIIGGQSLSSFAVVEANYLYGRKVVASSMPQYRG